MAMNENDRLSDTELEALFQAARAQEVQPSEALWARVLADSETCLPAAAAVVGLSRPHRPGRLAGLFAAVGGWPSLASLTAVTLTGVWIGFSNPAALDNWAQIGLLPGMADNISYDLGDFEPDSHGLSALLEEG